MAHEFGVQGSGVHLWFYGFRAWGLGCIVGTVPRWGIPQSRRTSFRKDLLYGMGPGIGEVLLGILNDNKNNYYGRYCYREWKNPT